MAKPISTETQNEAMKVAKATQKPGQAKEQTKLIALGIEKGIAEYKKQQKSKARDRDKSRKQDIKAKARAAESEVSEDVDVDVDSNAKGNLLPWALLIISWLGFIGYIVIK